MASQKKNRTRLKPLSHGRPPTVKPPRRVSRKATRTLIRSHHTLEKQRAKAIMDGDKSKASAIAEAIESQGGIEGYQHASLLGQGNERGGDSSRILMEWLGPVCSMLTSQSKTGTRFRMLEVGALSTANECSKSHLFEMERIDLHSQAEGIKSQDFMERPLPKLVEEEFDIISLSLGEFKPSFVLNYVPDAVGRGNMLLRTLKFLKTSQSEEVLAVFPCLFLVLPAACVTNSRYLDEGKLEAIMESLGYVSMQKKISNKLVYYLWRLVSTVQKQTFKKVEIRSGKSRNNFAVVLN